MIIIRGWMVLGVIILLPLIALGWVLWLAFLVLLVFCGLVTQAITSLKGRHRHE
jgi:hypothetical protein